MNQANTNLSPYVMPFKIITKVFSNKLKPLLPKPISEERSSYVEGRKILDGIIDAHEVFHSWKLPKGKERYKKLDMSKDFEIINWEYIQQMLLAFGFS